MPGARGVKRTASKASSTAAAALPKNKKKRVAVQLEVPTPSKRKGCVLTCGQGDVGQLGLGEDVMETTRFRPVTDLKDNIVQVVAGGMHTVALDSDGKVWTFGCNDEGALGRGGEEGAPGAVQLPGPAALVAAGDSHSAALLQDGAVYAWGAFRDSHGSMGLLPGGLPARASKPSAEPVLLQLPERVADLASGQDHLVLLTVSGAVYTMGCGEQGQLGRLSQRSASRDTRQGFGPLLTPGRVALKFPARRVWAGSHGSVALQDGGALHAWGLNNYHQLGVGGEQRRAALFAPARCDAFAAVDAAWTQLALAQHHTVALAAGGAVYTLGRREYGRLGLGDACADAERPALVPALRARRCVCVAAGTSSSFAVAAPGALLAWGMGSEGQLGTGARDDRAEPAPADPRHLARLRVAAVSAGGQHTVLLAVPIKDAENAAEEEKAAEEQTEPTATTTDRVHDTESAAAKKVEVTETESSDNVTDETTARPKRKIEQLAVDNNLTDNKKQKVNGDENIDSDTKMDVEHSVTEKTEEPSATEKKEEAPKVEETTTEKKQDMDIDKNTSSEDNNTDTSSQDSVQPADVHMNDVTPPTNKPAVTTVA